eukprot:TRINITY_DN35655_c0_g1_i1.p1 TRINITY_DN35655_c0_g1~~TRINITY_DN35655_c0_g1_i1.p1  ORF type:complete len:506 (+),score=83.63 TRINITY_DN35655_c0_g1_i1:30-1520(+)
MAMAATANFGLGKSSGLRPTTFDVTVARLHNSVSVVDPASATFRSTAMGDESQALLLCSCFPVVLAGVSARRRFRTGRTHMFVRGPRAPMRKNPSSKGPKMLKSGYWQEPIELDEDIDIYEWLSADQLSKDPPAEIKDVSEMAAFTVYPNCKPEAYAAPEYRPPPRKLQLTKALSDSPPVDQGPTSFTADIRQQLADFGNEESCSLEDIDIITSLPALRNLLAFVDGRLQEDMRSKGCHTHLRTPATDVDMFRIGRLPEAPKAISIATVWNWEPARATGKDASFNKRSYSANFQQVVSGREISGGPPSIRSLDTPMHYRLLRYTLGDLKMLVRVPVVCTVPVIDEEVMERPGMAVEASSARQNDAGALWDQWMKSRYALMQLGEIGMIARGIEQSGALIELQELTRQDLQLDRPTLEEEAQSLLGKLAGLLRRVKEVADCPGCQDRQRIYINYCDAELRIISPREDEEMEELASAPKMSDKQILQVLNGEIGRAHV